MQGVSILKPRVVQGLIVYSKRIILSAMENICWRRERLGSEEALTEKMRT